MEREELEKKLSPGKLMIPVAIGLAVVSYLFYKEFDATLFSQLRWTSRTTWSLIFIVALIFFRFLGYILRLRILTEKKLNWKSCFEVISLWSFGSAISPSAVGGTALAIFILNKEKINVGKSTTIAITTLLLDLIFFVVFSLIMYWVLGGDLFFGGDKDCGDQIGMQNIFGSYRAFFFTGLAGTVVYLSIIAYAVLINPKTIYRLFNWLFSFRFLNKWKTNALKVAQDLEESSNHLQYKTSKYWVGLFATTMLAWTARFLLVNPIVGAFVDLNITEQLTIFARNFVLWMVMIMPTTPGASGVAELSLSELICEFMPYESLGPLLILVWRFFDYFLYLFLGIIILPRWIRRVF